MNKPCSEERSFQRNYKQWEEKWNLLLQEFYPEAELVKWGSRHRVYKQDRRIIKIQHSSAHTDPLQRIENEFAIYQAVEGKAWSAHPVLNSIDKEWKVLEIDWVEGELLENLIKDRPDTAWLKSTLKTLFILALNGVVYKQFRLRHIIRKQSGEVVFIDFGGSQLKKPLEALTQTFLPLQKTDLLNERVWGMLRMGVKNKINTIFRNKLNVREHSTLATERHLKLIIRRRNRNLSRRQNVNLHKKPANFEPNTPMEYLACMETHIAKAVQADSSIIMDLFRVELGAYKYMYYGNRYWGLIWDYISHKLNFKGKRIVDLGCSMGLASVFARIEGAKHAIMVEGNLDMLEAARCFAKALEVEGNEYIRMEWNDLLANSPAFLCTDVTIALSTRCTILNEENLLSLFSRSNEIIYQSLGNFDVIEKRLKELGFNHVTPLIPSCKNWKLEGYKPYYTQSIKDYHIIYATRGVAFQEIK